MSNPMNTNKRCSVNRRSFFKLALGTVTAVVLAPAVAVLPTPLPKLPKRGRLYLNGNSILRNVEAVDCDVVLRGPCAVVENSSFMWDTSL